MAFTIQNWCRASASANEPLYTLADASVSGCFRDYNYYTADSQATVSVASYFDSVAYDLVSGDYINVYSSTDSSKCQYRVTNTSGVITLSFIGGFVQATVAPTLAAFIAMYTTPVTILAAPGANRQLVFQGAQVTVDYGSAALAAGGAGHIQYATTTAGAGTKASATVAATVFTNIAADSSFTFIPAAVINTAVASVVNQPLCLSCATQDFTGGTADVFTVSASAFIVPALY